jgi:uncharacterized protein YmfQ (DUF2313 family)
MLADDYYALLLGLRPVGPAWPADDDQLRALADGLARAHGRALVLQEEEADPRSTSEMLAGWERNAGLPDPCSPAGQTTPERQAALVERLTARGGQSRAYFIGIAAALGYAVEIAEFRPFVAGRNRIGDPLNGPAEVRACWRVSVGAARIAQFRSGAGRAGADRLGRIRRAEDLECIFRRLAPAHTTLIFDYLGA